MFHRWGRIQVTEERHNWIPHCLGWRTEWNLISFRKEQRSLAFGTFPEGAARSVGDTAARAVKNTPCHRVLAVRTTLIV